jgi:hypothetical protein
MLRNPYNGGVRMPKSTSCRYSKEFRAESMKLFVKCWVSAYGA